jgi:zinc D-Ala-D-Ala dipeptidase
MQTHRSADLVEVTHFDATIFTDIKYARDDNFMGRPLYKSARAMLQRPAAAALATAQRALEAHGLGLLVYDAYRPWSVTKQMWDETPPEHRMFVADPGVGSKHNRGCAVDATLCRRQNGETLPMPSEFDEFTERALAHYGGGALDAQDNRGLLVRVMFRAGFAVNPREWWHFDFYMWPEYEVLDQPLV